MKTFLLSLLFTLCFTFSSLAEDLVPECITPGYYKDKHVETVEEQGMTASYFEKDEEFVAMFNGVPPIAKSKASHIVYLMIEELPQSTMIGYFHEGCFVGQKLHKTDDVRLFQKLIQKRWKDQGEKPAPTKWERDS